VLENTWEDLKQSLKTLWEALPYTADEEATEAARGRIADGTMGTLEGIGKLMGPPPGMVMGAYMSGNAEAIALVQEMQKQQQEASQAIINSIKESWNEAEERSGTVGAVAMVATTLATEVVGSKGTRAVGSAASVVRQATRLPSKIPADSPPRNLRRRDGFMVTSDGKRRLKPGPYRRNGYDYTTDSHGRIKTVEGDLRLEDGKRNSYQQRIAGRNDGRLVDGEDGGHLIATRFGGDGGLENLTPMNSNLNKGRWKAMENRWARELKNGSTVKVKIELIYGDDTMRASQFRITEMINGIESKIILQNPK